MANGRKRRWSILSLRDGDSIISDSVVLQHHIYGFYRKLLGSGECGGAAISPLAWVEQGKVSVAENAELTTAFSLLEVEEALKATKTYIAPGPDGFPVLFYKKFCPLLGEQIFQLIDAFKHGLVDIKSLNFWVLTLLAKVNREESIRQVRPTALISVVFKLVVKGFAC